MMTRDRAIGRYVLADYLSTNAAWLLFNLLRFSLMGLSREWITLEEYLLSQTVWMGQLFVPLFMLLLFYLSGYYNRPFFKSGLQEFYSTLSTVAIQVVAISFVMLFDDWNRFPLNNYWLLAVLYITQFSVIYMVRRLVTKGLSRLIDRGKLTFNTLVVGEPDQPQPQIRTKGYRVVAHLSSSQLSDVGRVIAEQQIAYIVIARGYSEEALNGILYHTMAYDIPVKMDVECEDVILKHSFQTTGLFTPFDELRVTPQSECGKCVKRTFDVVVSLLALLLLSPLLSLIALLVWRDSKSTVIYRQERIGYRKRPFTLYKFRSMVVDAESGGQPCLSSENDPRITPIGRVLRKYRLDELPQFWNVVKGDMSIVGPRPERQHYIDQIVKCAPYYNMLHQIRPGITSWGMVKYGYARNVEEMLRRLKYDILYLKNISLVIDLKIIVYTVRTVLTGKGI